MDAVLSVALETCALVSAPTFSFSPYSFPALYYSLYFMLASVFWRGFAQLLSYALLICVPCAAAEFRNCCQSSAVLFDLISIFAGAFKAFTVKVPCLVKRVMALSNCSC